MKHLETRLQERINASLYALLFLTVLLGLSVLLESCADKCEVTNEFSYYEPVFTTLADLRNAVEVVEPQPVKQVGKMYFKDGYLFINEPAEGIHIIDNHDPSNPVSLHFLKIPGTFELAVKGNTLYADSFVDLIAFNITDINNITEIDRIENLFSNYNSLGFYADPTRGVVTDWVLKNNVQVYETECDAPMQAWGGMYYETGVAILASSNFDKSAALTPGNGSGPGVGGSMSRFTISHDHLYALDGGDIQTVDISVETDPSAKGRTAIAWDMETIFPHGEHLFIGARSGMHIVSLASPETPSFVSTYSHVRVCDPVVVQDTLAYVTLRSGTECEGFTNQLEIINISNLQSPQLIRSYPMTNPHGLGIDGEHLFICDGAAGLKIYNASDIQSIDQHLLAEYGGIQAYDVIPFNKVAMMIGADGIFQYDYSDPAAIKLLSKIAIQP